MTLVEPPSYLNFYAGPKDNGVRYKRASFDRVPAYVGALTTPTTQLDQSRRLSLYESQTSNSNNPIYHTRNESEGYTNTNIERAILYANTTLATTNNNHNGRTGNELEGIMQNENEEPVDPRAKQVLSIGDNMFEVETNTEQLNGTKAQDEIEKALANMGIIDEYDNINNINTNNNNDNTNNNNNNNNNYNNNSNDSSNEITTSNNQILVESLQINTSIEMDSISKNNGGGLVCSINYSFFTSTTATAWDNKWTGRFKKTTIRLH